MSGMFQRYFDAAVDDIQKWQERSRLVDDSLDRLAEDRVGFILWNEQPRGCTFRG